MSCCGHKRFQSADAAANSTQNQSQDQPLKPGVNHNSDYGSGASFQPNTSNGASRSLVAIRYLETSPVLVVGGVTGTRYQFSSTSPVRGVDARDAAALIRTRFFRLA